MVDPYLPYLASRWNRGCHNTALLYEEIIVQGYTGSQRTLRRQLQAFRHTRERPVSKQTIILDNPPSPRGVALLMVRPAQNRTAEQTAYLEQLIQSDETAAVVFMLAQDFGRLLRQREGLLRLEQWKAAVRESRDCGIDCICRWTGRRCRGCSQRMHHDLEQWHGRGVRE
jgi:transposase